MDEASHKLNFKPFIIKDLLMSITPEAGRWIPGFVYRFLSRILRIDIMNVPINKHRAQATAYVRRITAMFESDVQLMSFPAGLVSRRRIQQHKTLSCRL